MARTPETCAEMARLAIGAVLSKTLIVPGRSVTNMRPSDATATSHGTMSPDWITVSVIAGLAADGLVDGAAMPPPGAHALARDARTTPTARLRPPTAAHCPRRRDILRRCPRL